MVKRFPQIILIVLLVLLGYGIYTQVSAASRAAIPPATTTFLWPTPPPSRKPSSRWLLLGVQSVFERVKGVIDTTAGYSGGSADTATYYRSAPEATGHAESVKVVYDPSVITYGQLLRIFFSVAHDPTQLNRQGPTLALLPLGHLLRK